jgi:MYXO-CTERM domain-containing protein
VDAAWLFADADGDGAGGEDDAAWRCPGEGWSATPDCDDADPTVAGEVTWYVDGDGDGLGEPSSAETGCTPPEGVVFVAGDCDDADPGFGEDCTPATDDPPPGDGFEAPPEPDFGCGCSTGGSGGAWILGLTALAWARRPARNTLRACSRSTASPG